jgi:hypothetical protein
MGDAIAVVEDGAGVAVMEDTTAGDVAMGEEVAGVELASLMA